LVFGQDGNQDVLAGYQRVQAVDGDGGRGIKQNDVVLLWKQPLVDRLLDPQHIGGLVEAAHPLRQQTGRRNEVEATHRQNLDVARLAIVLKEGQDRVFGGAFGEP
jgi:hypothetical protein